MDGLLFIVTAPSGAGKTTLVSRLLACEPGVHLSVSHTTRQQRPGEIPGENYHFIAKSEFIAMRDRGEFLEWAEVFGYFYGTSRHWLEERLKTGHDVLLEIDWQGAEQVRAAFSRTIGIFILPPTIDELEKRLCLRGQDSAETIATRLSGAREEISHVDEFDYVIINRDLDEAITDLRSIVRASRLSRSVWRDRHPLLKF